MIRNLMKTDVPWRCMVSSLKWAFECIKKSTPISPYFRFILSHVYEHFAHMWVYAPWVCLVLKEVRKVWQIPWNWNDRQLWTAMWALGIKPRQAVCKNSKCSELLSHLSSSASQFSGWFWHWSLPRVYIRLSQYGETEESPGTYLGLAMGTFSWRKEKKEKLILLLISQAVLSLPWKSAHHFQLF